MSVTPPPFRPPVPVEKALRRLFLTLFLRGRSARGLKAGQTPPSLGKKLFLTLLFYMLFGCLALMFARQSTFLLSLYLHSMTMVFVGMFVAASAGEVLFNKEEGDILQHRPVTAQMLLWAKVSVLLQVSLWLAAAFNLAGFAVGIFAPGGHWLFLPAHAFSSALLALGCTSGIVLTYQLCLRWFGRERLDGLMTTVQIFVSIFTILSGQVVPRMIPYLGGKLELSAQNWWLALLPPTWFAGLDAVLLGRFSVSSLLLAGVALGLTALVTWLAFHRLARNYETGLQLLNETVSPARPQASGVRWEHRLTALLRPWLGNSVERASFLLTLSYLSRDRDVKLRVYPGIAPMLILPVILLLQERSGGLGFGVAFAGFYLGLIPYLGLGMIRYSQQWQAADIFRAAPQSGPAPFCHGSRRAVLVFLTLPMLVFFGGLAWLLQRHNPQLILLLPGMIALPLFALVPCLRGQAVPFSLPTEEAKSAGRGLTMMGVMIIAAALSALAVLARHKGWFHYFLLGEIAIAVVIYLGLRSSINKARWPAME